MLAHERAWWGHDLALRRPGPYYAQPDMAWHDQARRGSFDEGGITTSKPYLI